MQVISPHQVMGIVEIVEHLSTVQDKVYDEPTVLVVDNVTGALGRALEDQMPSVNSSDFAAGMFYDCHVPCICAQ